MSKEINKLPWNYKAIFDCYQTDSTNNQNIKSFTIFRNEDKIWRLQYWLEEEGFAVAIDSRITDSEKAISMLKAYAERL